MTVVKNFLCIIWFAVLGCGVITTQAVQAQPGKPKKPVKTASGKAEPREIFTLIYKPQLGTLLYDIKTTVQHNIGQGKSVFQVGSDAQLAINNTDVDIDQEVWTYERYYAKLNTVLSDAQLQIGHDSTIREHGAINRVYRAKYSWRGKELSARTLDTLRLSDEAQFMYYFQGPHLFIPLPEEQVAVGAKWEGHRTDSVVLQDGLYSYDINTLYTFDSLVDTLGGVAARIISKNEGTFKGYQRAGEDTLYLSAPITGTDTLYLSMYTGTIIFSEVNESIPVIGRSSHGGEVSDALEVRSNIALNGTNMRSLGRKEGQ